MVLCLTSYSPPPLSLGSETHLLIRHDKVLRTFDSIIQDTLTEHMEGTGINMHKKTNITKVVKESSGALTLSLDTGKTLEVDTLLWAIGRHPETKNLNLSAAGVETDDHGFIKVDAYQKTSTDNVFAVGDVIGKALLTPVAIAAGRRLSNRLFGGEEFKDDKLDYDNIPSVIFSHPTAGSVGLTEDEAKAKHGEDKIKVYKTKFTGMVRPVSAFDPSRPPCPSRLTDSAVIFLRIPVPSRTRCSTTRRTRRRRRTSSSRSCQPKRCWVCISLVKGQTRSCSLSALPSRWARPRRTWTTRLPSVRFLFFFLFASFLHFSVLSD
jgi:hypothetical protein